MKLYDDKDIALVANVIDAVGPDSLSQRARLAIEAAIKAGCSITNLEMALLWYVGEGT